MPHRNRAGRRTVRCRTIDLWHGGAEEALSEERRLCLGAFTRSRTCLKLSQRSRRRRSRCQRSRRQRNGAHGRALALQSAPWQVARWGLLAALRHRRQLEPYPGGAARRPSPRSLCSRSRRHRIARAEEQQQHLQNTPGAMLSGGPRGPPSPHRCWPLGDRRTWALPLRHRTLLSQHTIPSEGAREQPSTRASGGPAC